MASSARDESQLSTEKEIVTYKGNKYYKVPQHGKIGIGALHILKENYHNSYHTELHTIKHDHTVGRTASEFTQRYFFNRVTNYEYKVEKFDVNNIFS